MVNDQLIHIHCDFRVGRVGVITHGHVVNAYKTYLESVSNHG